MRAAILALFISASVTTAFVRAPPMVATTSVADCVGAWHILEGRLRAYVASEPTDLRPTLPRRPRRGSPRSRPSPARARARVPFGASFRPSARATLVESPRYLRASRRRLRSGQRVPRRRVLGRHRRHPARTAQDPGASPRLRGNSRGARRAVPTPHVFRRATYRRDVSWTTSARRRSPAFAR